MKYSNLYIFSALLASVLASCTKDENHAWGSFPEDGVVRISASVAAPVTRADAVVSPKIYDGTDLGLFIDYGDEDDYMRKNVRWINDGTNNWTTELQMLWKSVTAGAQVYAYSPFIKRQNDPKNVCITIPTDQSAGIDVADYLWWYPVDAESGKVKAFVPEKDLTDGKIDIAFRHALIKLTVNFDLGSQFEGKNISVKEAWFHGSADKCSINFTGDDHPDNIPYVGYADRTITPPDIKMHDCSSEGKLSCEVIFFPHTSLKSGFKLLTVTLSDGRDYTLTLGAGLDFKKDAVGAYLVGTAYEMAVTVGKDKLVMGAVTVADWDDKGSVGENFWTDATEYSEWGGPEDVATEYAGGDGSKDDPFQIATAAQIAYMAKETNNGKYYNEFKYFELTSNIDLKGFDWTPIGTQAHGFAGVFDGGGNVITNLKVSGDNDRAGLFGTVGAESDGAEIKDIVIRNASVSAASSNAGIVAGFCDLSRGKCTISGCKVDGNVVSNCFAGGILGSSSGGLSTSLLIENCTADVNCTVENGQVNASCGGIVGWLDSGVIRGCTVLGKVEGTFNVGGLAGRLDNGDINSPFNYVYAEVGISKASSVECHIGGLVGDVDGIEIHSILNCRMYGKVWCAEGLNASIYIGGAVGYACSVKLENLCFYGSVVAGKPADERGLYAGAFIGWLLYDVMASRCTYQIDGTAGLPVCGFVSSMDDVSGLDIVGKK